MKKKIFFIIAAVIFTALVFISASASGEVENIQDIKNLDLSVKPMDINSRGAVKPDLDFGKIPLYFISNKGQVNEKAKFYAKASRYTLWLTKEGLVFDSTRKIEEGEGSNRFPHSPHSHYSPHSPKLERDVSRLIFLNANKNPKIVPMNEAKLRVNYFTGNDKCKWNCDIPTSKAILYKNLYKNIDLKVYGIEKQIEYDWIIKPGGNPGDIKFEYKNVKGTRVDNEGNLLLETDFGELMHKKPVSYQKRKAQSAERKAQNEGLEAGLRACPEDNERKEVNVIFKKIAKNTYGFDVGKYDKTRELVIDPVVLAYSTYLGGLGAESSFGIAVDNSGNVYVAGYTDSSDFPILNQYQEYQGDTDVFITRMDTNEGGVSSLVCSTYLGGADTDWGNGIAINGAGNAYVTGYTYSSDFPTLNQYQGAPAEYSYKAFVTRLDINQSGAASLFYSTYLGGTGHDSGYDIAVDGNDNAYVVGHTGSSDFPTLNQYQEYPGDEYHNVFVSRIDTNQSGVSSLVYSTYLGGDDTDRCFGIAVDGSGNAYVTGYTRSTNFPTYNQYQGHPGGYDYNVFVSRVDTNQSGVSSLIYSTYLGGSYWDEGHDIAVDGTGNAYITGITYSTDFPILNQYQACQGSADAFVTRLDTNQSGISSLIYSTYLGGSTMDEGAGIAVDGGGNAYVTGCTDSTDFPTLYQYQGDQGYNDVFITRVNTNHVGAASLIYSTYLGGSTLDGGTDIAIDSSGNVYITGFTDSTDFPTHNQYQEGQDLDTFVTKLTYTIGLPTVTTSAVSSINYNSAESGGEVTDDGGAAITARGVCWCISPNPTLADNYSSDGTGTGVFTSSMTELAPDMVYYVRAYATNSAGTAYGNQLTFTTLSAPPCMPAEERAALIALYNSTGGDNWYDNSGWKTPPLESDGFAAYGTEDTWYGVTVTDCHVTRLDYWANNLVGTLPPEIADLSYLEELELVLNFDLTGSIPAALGNLNNLELLYLSANELSGPIPPELGNLGNLKHLVIKEEVSGTIPPQLGNLGSLEYLLLRGNLTGSIPPELGNLSNLQHIYLNLNQLSGPIPVEIGNLTNLNTIDFRSNQLSGSIPPELGNLINLQNILLSSNQFSGSIPVEIGNLTNLYSIYFDNNQLSGNIPAELGNLVNLFEIDIDCNRLEGNLPPELGNLVNLEYLDLQSNLLGGSIPAELGNLSSLKWLDLYNNQLSGPIPPELGNLGNLIELFLCQNLLSGPIPSQLEDLVNLERIFLSRNRLSGTIPTELGNLNNLKTLDLSGNMLTGNIPSSLANLSNFHIYSLGIDYNALHTDDETLIAFLDATNQGWEETQTISPPDVSAVVLSDSSVEVSWTPIIYSGDTGGYRVFYNTTPGGTYTLFDTTEDKTASSMVVTGLAPDTVYYFMVQTRTEPHWYNDNTVDSEYSAKVSATTLPGPGITVTSPNGGETWTAGSAQTINWNTTGTVDDVKIELSTDNGANWTDIISSTTNDGIHSWTVPGTPSNQCLIRISETDGAPVDISDGVFTIAASTTGIPAEERAALIALYNSTAGDNWTDNSNWKTAPVESDGFAAYGSEDSWYGVTVSGDHVTEISLNNNHLVGTIPTQLENLGDLQNLELQSNQLSGTIPTSLTNLVNLLSTDIGYNALYTGDETLRAFLNSKDPDWEDTQTTAPTGLSAAALTDSSVELSWTPIIYTDDTGGYRVFYSTDAGGPYTFFDNTVDKTVSSMTVTGLTPATTYYFVVLTRTDPHPNNANTVDSEYSTEVSASTAEIWLNSPNGGESLTPGSTYLITWSGSEIFDFVSIEYSIDNGGTWKEIVSSTANSGGYDWTVPGTPSGNCLVRVRVTDEDEGPSDVSDAVFSIDSAPGIIVTSPNGGENLTAGTIHEITWLSSGDIDDIFIYYSTDRGASWTPIVESTANTGSYNWTVPDTPAEDCLVRVIGGDADGSPSDISNTVFSIFPASSPTLIVTFPNGGEQLTTALSYEITWSATGTLENVKIEYSLDNGVSWTTDIESTGNTGSYNWAIPDTPSDNCLVRVSDTGGNPYDVSNAVFAIVLPPTLTITSPNGGESLEVGSPHEITWTSTGTAGCIMIEYSTDSGTTWTTIEASASNEGSYDWTVPDTPSDNCLIRISGCDCDDAPLDSSDAVFSISGV